MVSTRKALKFSGVLLLLIAGDVRSYGESIAQPIVGSRLPVMVDFSTNGKYAVAAIGGNFKPIYVLDARDGKIIRAIYPDCENARDFYTFGSFAISPDSKWIATSCGDGRVRCWELETGKLVYKILLIDQQKKSSYLKGIEFSSDGRYLLVGGRHCFRVIDFKDEPKVTTLSETETSAVAYIPKKDAFVTAGWKVLVFDAKGKYEIGAMKYGGRSSYITCIAFSPDGKRGAIIELDKPIKIIDAESAEELMEIGGTPKLTNVPRTVAFGPDGQEFAAPMEKKLIMWRTVDGRQIRSVGPLEEDIVSFAYSPDGTTVVLGDRGGSASLWDAKQNKRVWEFKIPIKPLSEKQRQIFYEFEIGKRKATTK